MPNFAELLQQGGAHAWLYFPSAILLGALHGLEPGHSKTMMAAFIVAIRGSVKQAVLLGLAATLSHTAVVWLVAIGGMYLGMPEATACAIASGMPKKSAAKNKNNSNSGRCEGAENAPTPLIEYECMN